MEELYKYLTANQTKVWKEYQENKEKGIRQRAKECLRSFIEGVKQNPTITIDHVALAINTLIERGQIEVQYPLFRELILPVLVNQAKELKPGAYKAIARYEQYFYQDNQLALSLNKELSIHESYFDTEAVLERELAINSDDRNAAYLLANKIAHSLDYAIHELPTGLLWEIETFKNTIEKLKRLLEGYDLVDDKWSKRLSLLKAIAITWEEYLNQKKINTYKEFLEELCNSDSHMILEWPRSVIYDISIK